MIGEFVYLDYLIQKLLTIPHYVKEQKSKTYIKARITFIKNLFHKTKA